MDDIQRFGSPRDARRPWNRAVRVRGLCKGGHVRRTRAATGPASHASARALLTEPKGYPPVMRRPSIARTVVVSIVSAAVCGVIIAVGSLTAGAAAPPRCASSALILEGRGFGAYGSFHDYVHIAVRNDTSHPCTVRGTPTVALLDANANVIHARATRNRAVSAPITLATWRPAYFTIQFSLGAPCPRSFTVFGFAVALAPRATPLRMYDRILFCSPASVRVEPLTASARVAPPSASEAAGRRS
jgi:hypothetical protein